MADDAVLGQLKKLRERHGLTEGRLHQAGAVLSALGTSDPAEGVRRLIDALDGLGDGDRQRALRVDLGLDLERHLDREPTARERDLLGLRRSAYGLKITRDVKTLARWSDAAIADLRGRLIADTFTGDLYVVAAVSSDRIVGITIIEEHRGQPGDIRERRSTDIANPNQGASVPALIYAFPRDWAPAILHMAVVFQSHPAPSRAVALKSDSLVGLPFAADRYELDIQSDTASCIFRTPSRHHVYGIWWSYA